MAPIKAPEGYVFIPRPRGRSIAADLLAAADAIEDADRKIDVRTVSGGYHVREDVAQKFQESQPEEESEDEKEPAGPTAAEDERKAAEAEAAAQAAREAEQGYPEGAPNEKWGVRHLEAWAAAQDPAVELKGDKAEKLKTVLDAYKPAE